MNKMLFVASALVCSSVAFADVADANGYYDVTLTTKRLENVVKTATKTFNKKSNVTAQEQFDEFLPTVQNLPDFTVVDYKKTVKKIVFKYSYSDTSASKVVTETDKGVYDSGTGKVYLWNTAAAAKVSVTNGTPNAIVASEKDRKGVEKLQSGYVAYEVPLAMHKQFVATADNKAFGGFTGANNKAEDGTELNFAGFTAFGSGTMKNGNVNSVAGNVAMKDPTDPAEGAYGTWKIQIDSSKKNKGVNLTTVLRNKGCVEMFEEVGLDK